MHVTEDEVRLLINEVQRLRSELPAVEVKSAAGGSPGRPLRQSLSAFSNLSGGGTILFGLDETADFALVGVGNSQRLLEDIASAGAEMTPAVRPETTLVEIDGFPVVVSDVSEVSMEQKPCYITTGGLPGGAYIRVGLSNRRMTEYEVFGYVSNRGQPAFDRTPVERATLDDLEQRKIEEYFAHLRRTRPRNPIPSMPFETAAVRSGIAVDDNGVLRPTLAGLLTFGVFPQEFHSQLRIVFLRYYGTTTDQKGPRGERFLDNKSFEGSIDVLIEDSVIHVMASMQKSSLVQGLFRTDIPEYPEEAIREAIVNAVAHRDYSPMALGSHIQVRMFADRLEIESPGGLYGPVTVEDLETAQSTRNEKLMDLLEYQRVHGDYLVENRGSGIDTMVTAMQRAQLEPPVFVDTRSSFRVRFKNHTLLDPETIAWLNQFADRQISTNQRLALAFLLHNEAITNADLRRLTGLDMPSASQELRRLVTSGLIEQQGAKRWAAYVLAPLVSRASTDSDQDKILDFVRRQGSISSSQSQKLLKIDRNRASRLLREMVSSKTLTPVGKGRWTAYVLASARDNE
jgi:ATP-dependent DNA helicase RecG